MGFEENKPVLPKKVGLGFGVHSNDKLRVFKYCVMQVVLKLNCSPCFES